MFIYSSRKKTSIKIVLLSLLCLSVLLFSKTTAYADSYLSGSCGKNLKYEVKNGNLYITGTGKMDSYTGEGANASPFHYKSYKNIYIENGVTSVGRSAFYETRVTDSIYIADSVKTIEDTAFAWCTMEKLYMGNGVTNLGKMAVGRCDYLTEVQMSSKLKTLGFLTFYGDRKLASITFPNTLKTFEMGWISGCVSLKSLTIPASCKSVINNMYVCPNINASDYQLSSFKVAKGNKYFKTISGVLFSKNGKTLVTYPPAKAGTTYTLPSKVNNISKCAFDYVGKLKTLIVPNKKVTIEEYVFGTSTVKNIKCKGTAIVPTRNTFSNCYGITLFYKPAYKAEFNVFKGSNAANWYGATIKLKKW